MVRVPSLRLDRGQSRIKYMKNIKEIAKKDLVPGSKVPISYLLDYLKDGYSFADFISSYPWIKEADIKEALDEIKKREFTSQYAL